MFFLLVTSTYTQDQILSAKIISDGEPIDYAYIMNQRTNYGVESKNGGQIQIRVNENDTLIFRCLGYQDTTFIVTDQMLEKSNIFFAVMKQHYALDEVNVIHFYSYARFKQAFLNLKLPPEYKLEMPAIDLNEIATNEYFSKDNPGLGVTLGGWRPYLTKEQKQLRSIQNNKNYWERYNNLTSYENLSAYTGLKGPTLDSFIVYLRTQYTINPKLTDYEIMASVKVAFENFLALNELNQDTIDIK